MKTQPHPLAPFCRASVCRLLPSEPRRILSLTTEELERAGANAAEIRRIIAAQRLAQFSQEFSVSENASHTTAAQVAQTILNELPGLRFLSHEEFWCIPVDCRNQALRPYRTGAGTSRNCLVHAREVFAPAIEQRAESVFTCHNHPTGDLTPSDADCDSWYRLDNAGEILRVPVLDHFVVSRRGVYSHRQREIVVHCN